MRINIFGYIITIKKRFVPGKYIVSMDPAIGHSSTIISKVEVRDDKLEVIQMYPHPLSRDYGEENRKLIEEARKRFDDRQTDSGLYTVQFKQDIHCLVQCLHSLDTITKALPELKKIYQGADRIVREGKEAIDRYPELKPDWYKDGK